MEADTVIEKLLNEQPLAKFSIYTNIQTRIVQRLGQEILQCLDSGISLLPGEERRIRCDGRVYDQAYGQFWLWVLGSYEIVRTMCQAEECFSPRIVDELKDLKRRIWLIRIPFAKQELPGDDESPVRGEPSIYGIGHSPPDLKFEVKGEIVSARELIEQFALVFSGIRRSDVLANHRTRYGRDRTA